MNLCILLISFLLCYNLYGSEEETKGAKSRQGQQVPDYRVAQYVPKENHITPLNVELRPDRLSITLPHNIDLNKKPVGHASLFDSNGQPKQQPYFCFEGPKFVDLIDGSTVAIVAKSEHHGILKGLLIALGRRMASKGQYEIDISDLLSEMNQRKTSSGKKEMDPKSPWYGYSVLSRIAYEASLETGFNTRFYGFDNDSSIPACRNIDQRAYKQWNIVKTKDSEGKLYLQNGEILEIEKDFFTKFRNLEQNIKDHGLPIAAFGIGAVAFFVGALCSSDRKLLFASLGTMAGLAAGGVCLDKWRLQDKLKKKVSGYRTPLDIPDYCKQTGISGEDEFSKITPNDAWVFTGNVDEAYALSRVPSEKELQSQPASTAKFVRAHLAIHPTYIRQQ